jgi:polar amino acid transport system permease protein
MTTLPVLLTPGKAALSRPSGDGWRDLFGGGALGVVLAALGISILAGNAHAAPSLGGSPGVLAILLKWAPLVFQGFLFNLLVSVLSMLAGTGLGLWLGLGRVSQLRVLRRVSGAVIQFFRNAPWLVLLFYCMFLLPFSVSLPFGTVPLPDAAKAVIGLSLPVMANVAEIVRGGVQSIPLEQWESGEALAFSRRQILWMVILPQCLRRMIPPWMNLYAILTMSTTLISVVGIQDSMTLARAALVAEGRTELFIPMYLMLLSWFFLYCYPIARGTAALERRFRVRI